jgi:hypothetical protein
MPSRFVDLMEHPDQLSKKTIIEASLITQGHTITMTEQGFILYVPPENLIGTDFGYSLKALQAFESKGIVGIKEILKKNTKEALGSPEEVIRTTLTDEYTYLALASVNPFNAKKRVRIIGIFINFDSASSPNVRKMEKLAERYHWPIVAIKS